MTPLASTVCTLVLFGAPGLLIVAALGGSTKVKLTLAEQIFLVIGGSLLISGWTGLLFAELGLFSPASVAGAVGTSVALIAVVVRTRLSLRAGPVHVGEFLVGAALLGLVLAVYFPPFEHVLGGRDPGIYVNAGFHLARDGRIIYYDPVIEAIPEAERPLFFPDKELDPWSYLRFQGFRLESPDVPNVAPHGLHLYPVWIATASALFQMKSGLYATPFFAMMGALGFFFALKRLFDLEVAAWAAALLSGFQIQIWFARFPNSEVLVQFLFATALFLFYFMLEERSSLAGVLAGFALGSTLLARVESLLFVVPVALFFGYARMRRELGKPELSFLGGFALVALHAAIHDRWFAWPYVSSILGRHYWRWLGENLVLVAVVAAVAFIALDRLAMKIPTRLLDLAGSTRVRIGMAAGLFAIALYAYFVRPIWHGARTAPHDAEAFLRMGWYLYPAGLALAIAGAMWLVVRARRSQAFFLLVVLAFSLFFFYKVRVWHDHYFAMRRFIPVILPGFLTAIAFFLGQARRTLTGARELAPPAVAFVFLLVYLADGMRLWRHNEFAGSLDFVEDLARHIGDNDVVIFPRMEGLHLLELPLAQLEGRNVLEFYTLKPDRKLLESLLEKWRGRFDDVYFVTNYKISLSGLFTRHVKDFALATEKYQYAYTRPPNGPEPFHLRFTLSKAVDLNDLAERVPRLPRIDVGGSDDLQVAWFHEKELEEDGTSYRWSQRTSSVFLPAVGEANGSILLRMAGPKELQAPLHPLEVRLDDALLSRLELTRDFETYELALPRELAARAQARFAILTLTTETWRPENFVPEASDIRDLGVRVDWIEVR